MVLAIQASFYLKVNIVWILILKIVSRLLDLQEIMSIPFYATCIIRIKLRLIHQNSQFCKCLYSISDLGNWVNVTKHLHIKALDLQMSSVKLC